MYYTLAKRLHMHASTYLAASSGETAHLTVLHGRPADPVDARIATDHPVRGVHQDDLYKGDHLRNTETTRTCALLR
jgi:hypothetical protein